MSFPKACLTSGVVSRLSIGLTLLPLAVYAFGCSAIVNPDPSRLGGGTDVGTGDVPGVDAGPRPDVPAFDTGSDAPLECTGDGECDDSIACTTDLCRGNRCMHTVDDSLCDADERCNVTAGCVPIVCTRDEECLDDDLCNGDETCNPGGPGADSRTGCVPGADLVCNDGISCTQDSCDSRFGCVGTPDNAMCEDGIDCTTDACTATSGPSGCENVPFDSLCGDGCTTGAVCDRSSGCTDGTPRTCDDGTDCTADSCDLGVMGFCVNSPIDEDGDGAHPMMSPSGDTCVGGTDCDDTDRDIGPGRPEVCNGVDDNCDTRIDEGCPTLPDDCASAQPITITSGSGRATGNFGMLGADYAACGATGPDAIYYIDLTSASDVRIDTMGSAEVDTVLGVSAGTCDPALFAGACNDDQDPGPSGSRTLTSRIWLHNVGPRAPGGTLRVYILVKSWPATGSRDYAVNVTVGAARADSCAEPLDISGGGLIIGNIGLSGIGSPHRGTCDPDALSIGAEAILRIMTPPSDNLIFNLTARGTGFTPVLYTRGSGVSSCASGPQTACTTGNPAILTAVPTMSGRSTYVFVDNAMLTAGGSAAYTLSYDP